MGHPVKVATNTNIVYLQTRYSSKFSWFFWFSPIQRYDTTMRKWQILYLRTRYRSKLGWFLWFGPIHVTIRRNLAPCTCMGFAQLFLLSLTLFQAEPEVDEGVERQRRDMRLSPPLGSGLPVLLVLDPPVMAYYYTLARGIREIMQPQGPIMLPEFRLLSTYLACSTHSSPLSSSISTNRSWGL